MKTTPPYDEDQACDAFVRLHPAPATFESEYERVIRADSLRSAALSNFLDGWAARGEHDAKQGNRAIPVYIVMEDSRGDPSIEAVFLDQEKANAFAEAFGSVHNCWIEEQEADDRPPPTVRQYWTSAILLSTGAPYHGWKWYPGDRERWEFTDREMDPGHGVSDVHQGPGGAFAWAKSHDGPEQAKNLAVATRTAWLAENGEAPFVPEAMLSMLSARTMPPEGYDVPVSESRNPLHP